MGKKAKRKAEEVEDEGCFELVRFVCSGVEPPDDLSPEKGFVYPLDSVDVCASGCTKKVCLIPEEAERNSDRWFYDTCGRLGVDPAPLVISLARGVVPEELVVAPHCSAPAKKHCIAFLRMPKVKMVYAFNVTFLSIGDKTVHELACVKELDRRAAFGNLISTIDAAKDAISEGLYIRLCKAAKAAYDRSAPAED
tara:strand:+ start:923 stop:1507 length:585 start_codon:yes stop_codon:yes gene_type:complete